MEKIIEKAIGKIANGVEYEPQLKGLDKKLVKVTNANLELAVTQLVEKVESGYKVLVGGYVVDYIVGVGANGKLCINITDELQDALKKGEEQITIEFESEQGSLAFDSLFAVNKLESFVSIEYELTKDLFSNESFELNGKSAGSGAIDLTTGAYNFTHTDTVGLGERLDVVVKHTFDSRSKDTEKEKVCLTNGTEVEINQSGLGDGFKLNYNQFLVKDTGKRTENDEASEHFTFIDGKGNRHIFEEKYFYKNAEGEKVYVQKEQITIDQDKNLWTLVAEEKKAVEREITDGSLKLIAGLDGFEGMDKIDKDIQEITQVKEQIKEIQKYIANGYKQLYYNTKDTEFFNRTKLLSRLQSLIQIQTVKNERIDLIDQELLKEYQKEYDRANDDYINETNRRVYEKVIDKISDSGLSEVDKKLWAECQKSKTMNTARKNLQGANYYVSNGGTYTGFSTSNYISKRNSAYNATWSPKFTVGSGNHLDRAIAINQLYLPALEDAEKLDDEQAVFQTEKLAYEGEQLATKIEEYQILLLKKQQELKELERQVPVHYLMDENGMYMGFGKINVGAIPILELKENGNTQITEPEECNVFRLILIGDSYENTVFITYDKKQDQQNKIVAISHSNGKQIDFEYENEKLVEIVGALGEQTSFEYENNKLVEIKNGEKVTSFAYDENGNLTSVVDCNGNGFSLVHSATKIEVSDISKYNSIKNSEGIDNGEMLKYNMFEINFLDCLTTEIEDEKGNKLTYIFDKKGNTLSKTETRANGKTYAKTFEYVGDKCTFNISAYDNATDYVAEKQEVTLQGNPLQERKFVQELSAENIDSLNTSSANNFVFSAFALADSAFVCRDRNSSESYNEIDNANIQSFDEYKKKRRFELIAEILYAGEAEAQEQFCSFDWMNTGWQYLAFPVKLDKTKTLQSVKLIFDYSFNTNEAKVKEMSFKEGKWQLLQLNKDGLVVKAQNSENDSVEELFYDDKKRLVKETLTKDNITRQATFEYGKNGNLVLATDYFGIVTEREFNDKGELVKQSKYNQNEPATRFVEETILNEKDNEKTALNELGEEFKNVGVSANNYNGTATEISATVNGEDNSNVLSYTLGMLTKVSHNDFDWTYEYDYKKRLTKVNLLDNEYLTKEYEDNKTTTTLANGEKFVETFDEFGNVTKLEYSNSSKAETLLQNTFDEFGRLTETNENGVITNIEYDKFGNETKVQGTQNGKSFLKTAKYDKNKLTTKATTIEGTQSTDFTYDEQERLSKVQLPNGKEQTFTYDGLGRIKTESVGENAKTISYVKKNERTSNLVASEKYIKNGMTTDTTKYTYDNFGNIVKIEQNGLITKRYEYDLVGRLVREDDRAFNKTITYLYDKGGNITRRKEYPFTLWNTDKLQENVCELAKAQTESNNIEYDYNYKTNGNNDQLLEYCGKKFEYDEIGNPVVYMDKALKFEKGRELVEINDTIKKVEFKYNASGIRTSKTEKDLQTGETFVTDYYLDGNNIVREERSTILENVKTLIKTIDYTYGASGVIGFSIKSKIDTTTKEYLYVKNIQGDIIGIVDLEGNEIAKYDYTAFGKQKVFYKKDGEWHNIESETIADENNENCLVAITNPFRYRGYYFDTETELHYLTSRYYDAEVGRFVTIDDIAYIEPNKINGINLYAYCGNNPVMNVDYNGTIWWNPFSWDWGAIGRFVAGAALMMIGAAMTVINLPTASVPGLAVLSQISVSTVMYGVFMAASAFDQDIYNDMQRIGWNPFNTSESAVLGSSKVSFYKGVPVFHINNMNGSFSFGVIGLGSDKEQEVLKHERGHNTQLMSMGLIKFGLFIAIPSATCSIISRYNEDVRNRYFSLPWERTADLFGGVDANARTYEENSLLNAIIYLILGIII